MLIGGCLNGTGTKVYLTGVLNEILIRIIGCCALNVYVPAVILKKFLKEVF